jgi:hypothetical protein
MRKTIIFSGATLMLALLVSTEPAQAWFMEYRGTPEELRATCAGELAEAVSFTTCFTENGLWIQCWYAGWCRRGGERDISGGRGFGTRNYQPPQSLIDSGGNGGGTTAAPAPAPSGSGGPIIIN